MTGAGELRGTSFKKQTGQNELESGRVSPTVATIGQNTRNQRYTKTRGKRRVPTEKQLEPKVIRTITLRWKFEKRKPTQGGGASFVILVTLVPAGKSHQLFQASAAYVLG